MSTIPYFEPASSNFMAYTGAPPIQVDSSAALAPTKTKREGSLAVDSEVSVDSNSLDSMDAFWSRFATRNSCNKVVHERTYPIIRAIRERTSRNYVHDEVQRNDNRIMSQIYSNYIKKMKELLNSYSDSSLEEILQRKRWFLETGKEFEARGREFGRFRHANRKYKKDLSSARQAKGNAFSLALNSQGGMAQASSHKKTVRFKDLPESSNKDYETATDPHSNNINDLQAAGKTEIALRDTKDEKHMHRSRNNSANKPEIKRSKDPFDAGFKHRERNHSKYRLSIRGILKKETATNASIVPARTTTKRPAEVPGRSEPQHNELTRLQRTSSKMEKTRKKSGLVFSDDSNVTREEQAAQAHVRSNPSSKWNKSLALLRKGSLSSWYQERKHSEGPESKSEPSLTLGVPSVSMNTRRKSITPELSSLASNSPLRKYSRDIRRKLEEAKGAWKNHQKPVPAEQGLKNSNSKAKKPVDLQQYNGIGVGKVAKVTTVSSFIRYEFDIPEDLDASLEHLRLHGYLEE